MKKSLFLSVIFFLAGILVATLLMANPFHWEWPQTVSNRLMMMLHPQSEVVGTAAAGQLWTCGMHPQVLQDQPGTCPICGMKLTPVKGAGETTGADSGSGGERKILHWRAPMDATYISDQPGKSPMGMDLIPVYVDEETTPAPGTVKIDPVFVQNIGVRSVPVARQDIQFTIRTVGTLTYNERQLSWINTKYEGWIEKTFVNYVGEPVEKGQKLFEIYSPKLVNTQKEYLQAIQYSERLSRTGYPEVKARAAALLDSARERLLYWDVTPAQIEELEESAVIRRTVTVFSPVAGVVIAKMDQALEGMYAKAGMNLYKVADLSSIWLEAEIFESQIPWLKVGQEAIIELPYQPGTELRGTVRNLSPFFNDRTRTMKVSIELPNPEEKLRPDMYADVTFEVPSARGVLTVPEEAVIRSGKRNIAVLDLGDGTFQVREIILGVSGGGLLEVREGLEEGDRIVVSSQFLIDSESNLREAINQMVASRRGTQEDTRPQSGEQP